MISTSRTSDFQISGSAISSHKNIQFMRWLVDRPYDRIASQIIKASCHEAVLFKDTRGQVYSEEVLNKLKWGHIQICPKIGFIDVQVIPIQTTSLIQFGYLWNLRVGKCVGKIILKSPRDNSVKVRSLHHTVKLDLIDNWSHKVVIMWRKIDDNNHLYYDVVKLKQYIE